MLRGSTREAGEGVGKKCDRDVVVQATGLLFVFDKVSRGITMALAQTVKIHYTV